MQTQYRETGRTYPEDEQPNRASAAFQAHPSRRQTCTVELVLPGERLRRWLLLAVAAVLLYCNVAVILVPIHQRYPAVPSLPNIAEVADFFYIFGVFSSYETVNREVFIDAFVERSDGRQEWIRLDAKEHFPFGRGERQSRMWANRTVGRLTREHRDAQRFLLQKVKERENRLHPERQVLIVRVYEETWPRSTEGYEAERNRSTIRTAVWYEG
jgi:hypothetical protein